MKPDNRPAHPEAPAYPAYGYPAAAPSGPWPRFLHFLKRLWWVPVLTLAVAVSAAAVYSVLLPPAYQSTARLWVSGKLNLKENAYYSEELQFFFGTQMELLQSDKLKQAAQVRVQTVNPNLAPCPIELSVRQAPKSSMFIMSAKGEEPAYTQAYLDALIDEYLNYKKQVRAGTSDETLSSLSEQVYQHEKDLKAEQEKFTQYKRENNLAVLQQQGAAAGAYLAKLNTQLSDLKLENQFLGAMVADISTNGTGTNLLNVADAAMLNNPGFGGRSLPPEVFAAQQQIEIMKLQLEELTPFLRPKHPKIQRLTEEISRAEKLLAAYQQRSLEQIEPSRQARQLKIQAVQDSIKEWEASLTDANNRIAEGERLKTNIDRMQGVYDKLLGLLQSLDINKSLDQEVVSVMERASIALPAKPSLPLMLIVACAAGIGGGLMLVFLVARFDDRFTSMNDLMEQLDEEIVGQVPDVGRTPRKGKLKLVEPDDDRHMFAESYRNIRSSVFFMPTETARPKMLLVTSAVPNEGKSTVSANLARTMAFAGGKVLLIDGDMRRGKLHDYFGVERGGGLSKLLSEPGKLDEVIVGTKMPNLFVIPAGEPIPDVGEKFLSAQFEEFLKEARGRFDHIIMDSAPVFAADDAPTVAPKVDGVLFVVRSGFTKAGMARQALDILYQRQARVLGLVFNRANAASGSYYYYKYADYYYAGVRRNGAKLET